MIDAIEYATIVKQQQNAHTTQVKSLEDRIIDVCEQNPWLRGGRYEDDFKYYFGYYSIDELIAKFDHGNWGLREGFIYTISDTEHLVFVQQVNGGDEYLTIKHNGDSMFPFESISCGLIIAQSEDRFRRLMARLIKATDEELKRLDY